MPPVVLRENRSIGSRKAELEQKHLVALLNRMVGEKTSKAEKDGLWEVLDICRIHPDWMADARHFSWNPIEGPRPEVIFPEEFSWRSYELSNS